MKVKDMEALYVESLQDLYSAETQLVEALPKVMDAATDKELKAAIKAHLAETKEQQSRLQSMLKELGEQPGGHKCKAMEGLIKETEDLVTNVKEPRVLDAALIGGAQKVEHYEISGYGTARTFARLLGQDEQAKMLQESLDEEYAADETLNQLAEGMINAAALAAGDDKKAVSSK